MNSLKTLAAITIGAIILSLTFALATKDRSARFDADTKSGRSMQHIVNGDRGEFILRQDGVTIEAKWRGSFELNAAGTDIDQLERELEIEIEEDGEERRVVFERDDGAIKRRFYIDDEKQPDGADTDAAVAVLLTRFFRASGMKAEERVGILLDQSGASAVLQEIGMLQSDHAVRRYATVLTEKADLTDDEIGALIGYVEKIESDHDLGQSLQAILEHETVSAALMPALIAAARSIESDHDLRKLVEAFAKRPLNAEALDFALNLYERIESDHDLRQAAEALLENEALDEEGAARLLKAATTQIDSDHDMRLILVQSAARFSGGGAFAGAWLDGLSSIESSHDKRLAITELAEAGDHPAAVWRALIIATKTISSSHDQRLALIALAEQFDAEPELVSAYRDAAAKIESSHDREKALKAIGDAPDGN